MAYDISHELAFIDAFVMPRAMARCKALLNKQQRRHDFKNAVLSASLRPDRCKDVPYDQLAQLLRHKLPDIATRKCYLIAEHPDLDQTHRDLVEFLNDDSRWEEHRWEMVCDFIISIIPGRLAVLSFDNMGDTKIVCSA